MATKLYILLKYHIVAPLAGAAASTVTHPQQLLVLLLQLALQVPHPLLYAPVTLLRLHTDHSRGETGIC